MKKILIPVDFGSYAENAFVYALRLADSIKAEIHLLHVIPPSNIDSSPFLIRPYAELLKSAKSRMQHFYHNGINVSSSFLKNRPKVSNTVRGGDLREIVNDVIRDHQFDLMIMGTKGRMDDWNNVFGSTTAHLIKKVNCPVIIIPAAVKFQQFKEVIVGCADEGFIETLAKERINWLLNSTINYEYLRVLAEDSTFTSPPNSASITPASTATLQQIVGPDVVDRLLQYATDKKAELLIMKRSQKGWLSNLFSKSYTRQAVLDADIPVLLL